MFWFSGSKTCGILVPQPDLKPMPSAMEVWCLNHWTATEGPIRFIRIGCEFYKQVGKRMPPQELVGYIYHQRKSGEGEKTMFFLILE